MKVLALNSSPRGGGESKTGLMLNELVRGLREAGADVETVALREKRVEPCLGCYACWTTTPGTCVHRDDMAEELLPKWREADLVVYATPLYNYAMTATMKAFIERTLPAAEPFFEFAEGRMYHPVRHDNPAVAVLAVSGMPDAAHFGPLSAHVRYLFATPGRRLVAEIYRPAAELLAKPFLQQETGDVLAATVEAGRELGRSMAISPETLARIARPLVDAKAFAAVTNAMWKTCLAEGLTPKALADRGMSPRPDSLESFLLLFPLGFDTAAAGEREVVLQFSFSGEVEGVCHFGIGGGAVDARRGPAPRADLAVETPFEVWADVMTGKADGRRALTEGRCRASGDLSLLGRLFRRGRPGGGDGGRG